MLVTYKDELNRLKALSDRKALLKARLQETPRKDIETAGNIAESIQVLDIESALIKENAKYLFFLEYMPKVIQILAKYDGKKHGEKTAAKIRNEIKSTLNIGFYISDHTFHQTITIYPLTAEGFTDYRINSAECTLYGKENFLIDSENKIRVSVPSYEMDFHRNAAVDLDTRTKAWNISRRISELKRLEKEFSDKASELNHMLPPDVSGVHYLSMHYPEF